MEREYTANENVSESMTETENKNASEGGRRERPERIRLSDYIRERGRITEEELAMMIRPLAADLAGLEKAGVTDLPVTSALLYKNDDGGLSLLPDICGQEGRQSGGGYVYALCEILYEGVSGRKPPSRMLRILFDEMQPLEECGVKADASFRKIMEKGLHLEAGDSYRDCTELEQELSSWLARRRQKKKERNYRRTGAALLLAVTALLVIQVSERGEEKLRSMLETWSGREDAIRFNWLERINEKAEHWTNGAQIGEPAVTMEYSCEEDWKKNGGDYYYNLSDLSERLETLQVPYAIGTAGKNGEKLVIRMKQADMSEFLMEILCSYGSLYLEDQQGSRELLSEAKIVPEMREQDDSGWHVTFRGTSESTQKFLQNAEEKQEMIYLCFRNDQLAELKLAQIPELKENRYDLFFTKMLLGDGKVTEEMNRIADLLKVIDQYGNMKSSFSLELVQYSSSEAEAGERQEWRKEWELTQTSDVR